MPQKCLLSTGETARELGLSRDALLAALRGGAPEPQRRVAGRRLFDDHDVDRLRMWFKERGRSLPDPHSFQPNA
jgi:DNA-binding transcriptional MerR regulator